MLVSQLSRNTVVHITGDPESLEARLLAWLDAL